MRIQVLIAALCSTVLTVGSAQAPVKFETIDYKQGDTVLERRAHRALTVARQQQAKSWELPAAMSLARLWRD